MPQTSLPIVTVNVTESIVYVGESTMIGIEVNVKEGYHIQAGKVNDEFLIPTTLEINNHEFVTIDKLEFPISKQFQLEGNESRLQVYDGKFIIKLFLSPVTKIQSGKYLLDARLRYQACDSRSCLFPRVIDFSIPIDVTYEK
jgi:hypothetical protein